MKDIHEVLRRKQAQYTQLGKLQCDGCQGQRSALDCRVQASAQRNSALAVKAGS